MADTAPPKKAAPAPDAATQAGEAIGAQLKTAGAQVRASAERMTATGTELGMRLLDQAEENTRQAFVAMRAAAQARDMSEVMRIQGDYLRDQANRAMSQASEIGEMVAGLGRDTLAQLTPKD
ncbi:phasin family protein [Sphingomonas sp.]|uniref:phasin family protein n=1 Tax=Sphingomonas sp. TaxID=28214 RepID=UPI001D353577|nr:phasin family protein [Sphingomonas sp.]MBX9795734.1 phasin family protein [Sphingomonas sp.]